MSPADKDSIQWARTLMEQVIIPQLTTIYLDGCKQGLRVASKTVEHTLRLANEDPEVNLHPLQISSLEGLMDTLDGIDHTQLLPPDWENNLKAALDKAT